jgi:hypothetical protein
VSLDVLRLAIHVYVKTAKVFADDAQRKELDAT